MCRAAPARGSPRAGDATRTSVPASWHTGGPVVDPVAPVTLIFVAWNARRHLARALDAAVATGWPVIVVDNASTDGTSEYVRVRVPEAQLVAADRNLGFAGGVNAGVRESATPWVAGAQPRYRPYACGGRSDACRRRVDADIGAVGAQLVGPDGHPQPATACVAFPPSAPGRPTCCCWTTSGPATRRRGAISPPISTAPAIRISSSPPPRASSCAVQAFDAIGGFDTQFHPAWFEDVDFCQRMRAAGWRLRYAASAQVVHEGGVAMRALGLGSFSTIWYRNLLRYVAKQGSLPARVLIRPLLVIGMLLRSSHQPAARPPLEGARLPRCPPYRLRPVARRRAAELPTHTCVTRACAWRSRRPKPDSAGRFPGRYTLTRDQMRVAALLTALFLVAPATPARPTLDAQDRAAFLAWFTLLADAQFYRARRPTSPIVPRSCGTRRAKRCAITRPSGCDASPSRAAMSARLARAAWSPPAPACRSSASPTPRQPVTPSLPTRAPSFASMRRS